MKKLFFIAFIIINSNLFGQGMSIEPNFYCDSVPEMSSWKKMKEFWNKEIIQLNSESEKNDPDVMYCLAIARHNSMDQNLPELIDLLDKAIAINPNNPKYFAVRAIIKYNWGAWSPDYDIAEGCPDIKKAISMGLEKKLKNNSSVKGVLAHSSCK